MSRRAASIEPEDGECTPSPSAMQQAKTAAKHGHQLSAPVEQALPPPPPASFRPAGHSQTKVDQKHCRDMPSCATCDAAAPVLDPVFSRVERHFASACRHQVSASCLNNVWTRTPISLKLSTSSHGLTSHAILDWCSRW